MATGRTVAKWLRFYMDGANLSTYGRTVGPLKWEYEEADLTAQMGDSVRGYLPDTVSLGIGTADMLFYVGASGLPSLYATRGSGHDVMIPVGIQAAPAAGDPVYVGKFQAVNFQPMEDGKAAVIAVNWAEWDGSDLPSYTGPWGNMLHALGAEIAQNASTGDHDYGAATTKGGYMAYQINAGDGNATLNVQHSATAVGVDFVNLGGCTTGNIDCSVQSAGIVNTTTTTTTVNRYTRWQIVFDTATTVTFAMAFVRGI